MNRLLGVLALALVLAGCSGGAEPAAGAPPASTSATTVAAGPTSVPVSTDLPPAPPVEQWVDNGVRPQQALDLDMRAQLIRLGMKPVDATDTAARDLAYLVCSTRRAGLPDAQVNHLVSTAYPAADDAQAADIVLAARVYCLDT